MRENPNPQPSRPGAGLASFAAVQGRFLLLWGLLLVVALWLAWLVGD